METADSASSPLKENKVGDDSDALEPSDWNYKHDERIEPSKSEAIASLLSIGLGILISFLFMLSGEPLFGLAALAVGIGMPAIFTELGRRMVNDTIKNMKHEYKSGKESRYNQQNQTEVSKSKQICMDCGWQNPSNNNFCTDCGQELK